jgi:hypothetical protein
MPRNVVFVSYSHADERWLERLRTHLKALEIVHLVDIWDDTRIQGGSSYRSAISTAISEARVAVLLISPDFFASPFILKNEMPLLIRAARKKRILILPVIIRASRFPRTELEELQSMPRGRTLESVPPDEQEAELDRIAQRVEDFLQSSSGLAIRRADSLGWHVPPAHPLWTLLLRIILGMVALMALGVATWYWPPTEHIVEVATFDPVYGVLEQGCGNDRVPSRQRELWDLSLQRGVSVVASSSKSDRAPMNVVDGWHGDCASWLTDEKAPQQVTVDLKDTFVVERIALTNLYKPVVGSRPYDRAAVNVSITFSTDSIHFGNLLSRNASTQANAALGAREEVSAKSVRARYVRIEIQDCQLCEEVGPRLDEVEILGRYRVVASWWTRFVELVSRISTETV